MKLSASVVVGALAVGLMVGWLAHERVGGSAVVTEAAAPMAVHAIAQRWLTRWVSDTTNWARERARLRADSATLAQRAARDRRARLAADSAAEAAAARLIARARADDDGPTAQAADSGDVAIILAAGAACRVELGTCEQRVTNAEARRLVAEEQARRSARRAREVVVAALGALAVYLIAK